VSMENASALKEQSVVVYTASTSRRLQIIVELATRPVKMGRFVLMELVGLLALRMEAPSVLVAVSIYKTTVNTAENVGKHVEQVCPVSLESVWGVETESAKQVRIVKIAQKIANARLKLGNSQLVDHVLISIWYINITVPTTYRNAIHSRKDLT